MELRPISQIKASLGIDPTGPVQKFFTDTCAKHMDKYVPKDIGNLRNNVTLTTNSITYESPYAEYQYYGVREDGTHKVKHYTTPGTGPYWDKRMWSAESDRIIRQDQKKINGG